MQAPLQSPHILPALTSLRFFAAILVVLCHIPFLSNSDVPSIHWAANYIFAEGYVGVNFFFTLSGFILAESYSKRFSEGRVNIIDFYVARVARIVPLHLLSLLIFFPLIFIEKAEPINGMFFAKLTSNLALLQAFFPSRYWHFSFNSPSWSLSAEFFFYALFPLLVVTRSRLLLFLSIAIISVKIYLGITIGPDKQVFIQSIFPPLRVADFAIGILLNRVFASRCDQLTRYATRMQLSSVVMFIAFFSASSVFPNWTRSDVFYIVPIAGIVFAFAFNAGKLSRSISGPKLIALGEASFSLYLIHQIIIRYGAQSIRIFGFNPTSLEYFGIALTYILASVAVSLVIHRHFEIVANRRAKSALTLLVHKIWTDPLVKTANRSS